MYLVIKNAGQLRLCNDSKWRSFANFGSYPECVKEYRVPGWAHRKAAKVRGEVVFLPPNVTIDASGVVYGSAGQRTLSEYVVRP